MSEVAFIGLGTMGRGMVRNLIRAGHAGDRLEPDATRAAGGIGRTSHRPNPLPLRFAANPSSSYASQDRTLSARCSTRRCSTISAPTSW